MIACRDYQEGQITLPIYSAAALYDGAGLYWGVDGSSTSTCAMIRVADTAADIFAVLLQDRTAAQCATNISTPIIYSAKCMLVDNPKIWKVYYDMSTSNDSDVSSCTSSIITVSACDDNLDGSWVYANSGTGVGQLRFIKGANITTLTCNTSLTTQLDSTTDIILIRNVGRPTAGMGLDTTQYSMFASVLDETSSTNAIVLKNFMQGPMGTIDLNVTDNSQCETDGLNSRGVRFFSHVIWADTAVHAQGIS